MCFQGLQKDRKGQTKTDGLKRRVYRGCIQRKQRQTVKDETGKTDQKRGSREDVFKDYKKIKI